MSTTHLKMFQSKYWNLISVLPYYLHIDLKKWTQWKIAKTSFNCKVRLTVGFRWLAVTNLNQTILSAKYKSLILINQMFVDKYTWSGLICPRNVSSSSSGFLSKCKRRGFPVCDNAKSFDSNSSRRTNPLHS